MLDSRIRTDPFTADPGIAEWFFKPQPDPRLAIIPVLPMGGAGVLSWRPQATAWVSMRPPMPEAVPQRAAFNWLDRAYAEEAPGRKLGPKIDLAPADDTSKSPKNPAQQQLLSPQGPLNPQQQPLNQPPPSDSKLAARPAPRPTRLVPEPNADPSFADIPRRQPLSEAAYWAGCDVRGLRCVRLRGDDGAASTDGGRHWDGFPTDQNPAPFLVTNSVSLPLIPASDTFGGTTTTGIQSSARQAIINTQLPFSLSGYGVDDKVRGFRASRLSATLERSVGEYLRLTGASTRLNFFGLLPPEGASGPTLFGDVTARMFVLFADGRLMSTTLGLRSNAPDVVFHETKFISLPTGANLRSLHFQPDQQFGWISSGWNDGNEEGPLPAIFQTSDSGKTWERLFYRSHYAPWVLFFAMPGFTLAFFATAIAWRDFRDSRIDEGIAAVGTSDTPIGWRDLDVLGMKPLALALSRFVRNTSTTPPLTIAITGPWGTGKSSLMNLVAEDLHQRGASPVWFNAWHHQTEQSILAALLENIRGQAIPSAWRLSGLWFRMRLLYLHAGRDIVPLFLAIAVVVSVAWAFKWSAIGASLATLLNTSDWTKVGTWVDKASQWLDHVVFVGAGTLLLLIVKIYGTLNLKPSELMATLRGNAKLADFSAQLGFRYKFAKEFDAAGKALRTSTNPGLVIFIDDLDRCSPETLMAVLESINFLTTAGPCFIFLGMDEAKVVEIIAKQFADDQERARQYLKKLLNLTVPVPNVDVRNSIGLSFGDERPSDHASPWPDRARVALRYVPDVGIPAMALLLVIWLVASWANSLPIAVATPEAAPPSTARNEAGPVQGPTTVAPNSTADATSIDDIKIPVGTAEQLILHRQVSPYLGVAIALLLILMLGARRITMAKEDKVEDSKDFRAALAVWHPAVFAADPTPRGIKRHQNRLRLQAMRLRPAHETPDLLDRWFAIKPAAGTSLKISEPTLVALGGIIALCQDIPDWSVRPHPGPAAPRTAPSEAIIARCAQGFEQKFPDDWPPTKEAIDAFKALRRSL
ncbi:KAP family P-loop NTPase fold protein [Bradyrhizobium iriomotense]|nr:P-loop NTPase fold protein [Bradyrhizobium iriomotense]